MNRKMIFYIVGLAALLESALMLLPVLTALVYRESAGWYYAATMIFAAALGFALRKASRPKQKTVYVRGGFVCVALCWIVLSLLGAIPFTLCGDIPSYLDAVFEMVSGFTTTGSSILTDVEALTHCSLLWRSFSHWIGGMGILVFMAMIINLEGGQAAYLLRAESPGPSMTKMAPRLADSARLLYRIYFALTSAQFVCYLLGGMPLFDSLCNAFATAGTGGFSVRAESFAAYGNYAQTVTTVFMILFGVNFSVYALLLRRKAGEALRNDELKWYLAIIFSSVALITVNAAGSFSSLYSAFHHVAFTVASIITTTGFCTENYDLWPQFSRTILALLMLVGACAGSTGGGLKVSRVMLLYKGMRRELRLLVKPRSVGVVKMDGKGVDNDALRTVYGYFVFYVAFMILSILLVSLDGFDASTTISSVIAAFNNIGPGFGVVGPVGNFAAFSPLAKLVFILDMLFGRLEIYPMLLVMLPSTWRNLR